MKKATMALALSMLAIGTAAASACSAPDPGVLTYNTAPPAPAATTPAKDGGSNVPPANTGGNNSNTGDDAGAVATNDAGGGGTTGGGADSFLGETTPWASSPTAATARSKHQAAGQAQQTPGMECLVCHGAAGIGVQFLAAGFVGSKGAATSGASDVEVRIWSASSQAGASAHSDSDGFFWIKPTGTNIAAPFQVGIRDSTHAMLMPVEASGGGCNGSSCHGGGQGPVHL